MRSIWLGLGLTVQSQCAVGVLGLPHLARYDPRLSHGLPRGLLRHRVPAEIHAPRRVRPLPSPERLLGMERRGDERHPPDRDSTSRGVSADPRRKGGGTDDGSSCAVGHRRTGTAGQRAPHGSLAAFGLGEDLLGDGVGVVDRVLVVFEGDGGQMPRLRAGPLSVILRCGVGRGQSRRARGPGLMFSELGALTPTPTPHPPLPHSRRAWCNSLSKRC